MRSFHNIKRKYYRVSLSGFLLPYTLIYISDSTLTYIYPILADVAIENKVVLGLVLSATAIGSMLSDLLIPILLKNLSAYTSLFVGVLLSFSFPLSLWLAIFTGSIWLFALTCFISGFYLEFVIFGINEFMVKNKKPQEVEKSWSIISIIESLIDASSVFIGSTLVVLSLAYSPLFVIPVLFFALVAVANLGKQVKNLKHSEDIEKDIQPNKRAKTILQHFLSELKTFFQISYRNFAEILLLFAILTFDALIWTYGALWSIEKFGFEQNWLIVGVYQVGMLFGAVVLLKYSFFKFERTAVTICLLASFSIMVALNSIDSTSSLLFGIGIFITTCIFSFSWPLIQSIFTSIAQKQMNTTEEIIGVKRIMYGVSYISAPIVGGLVVESFSFGYLFGVSSLLLLIVSMIATGLLVARRYLSKSL